MTIRALLVADHIPEVANVIPYLAGQPITAYSAGTKTIGVDNAGWFAGTMNTSNTGTWIRLLANTIQDKTSQKSWFGGRLKSQTGASPSTVATNSAIGIGSVNYPTGTAWQVVISVGVLPVNRTVANTESQECWFEFSIDHTTFEVERYIDGVKFDSFIINDTAVRNLLTARNYALYIVVANGVNIVYKWRDMYFLDCDGKEGSTDRLGPRRATRLTKTLTDGGGWEPPSGMTLAAWLATALSSTNLLTPVAKTGTSGNALRIGLSSVNPNVDITAMAVVAGASRDNLSPNVLSVKLAAGSAETAAVKTTLTTTVQTGLNAGIFHERPQGGKWTAANTNALSAVIEAGV